MPTLEQTKDAISARFLAPPSRIHMVSIRVGSEIIVVRVDGKLDRQTIEEIRSWAKPYKLEIIESAPAYALQARRPSRRKNWSNIP